MMRLEVSEGNVVDIFNVRETTPISQHCLRIISEVREPNRSDRTVVRFKQREVTVSPQ